MQMPTSHFGSAIWEIQELCQHYYSLKFSWVNFLEVSTLMLSQNSIVGVGGFIMGEMLQQESGCFFSCVRSLLIVSDANVVWSAGLDWEKQHDEEVAVGVQGFKCGQNDQ